MEIIDIPKPGFFVLLSHRNVEIYLSMNFELIHEYLVAFLLFSFSECLF